MENTLFGSGSTKLTSGVVSEGFNLDTGLYEAMYESSQMELKILEAMIKADSLSRKYQAQGIYSESAIQAFNEEAKAKIGQAIKDWISGIGEKIKEWWSAFKTKAIEILRTIRRKLTGTYRIKNKDAIKASRERDTKRAAEKNAPVKALPAPSASTPVQKALSAPPPSSERAIPMPSSSKPSYDDVVVEWPKKIYNWEMKMNDALVDVTDYLQEMHAAVQKADAVMDERTSKAFKSMDEKAKDLIANLEGRKRTELANHAAGSATTSKRVADIPELAGDPMENIIKITKEKEAEISKCDNIINATTKSFNDFASELTTSANNPGLVGFVKQILGKLQQATMGVLNSFKNFATYELKCLSAVGGKLSTSHLGESVSSLVAEAVVYELFMANKSYDDYDLYSAEGIKRFAAAKLEAAMDEISDVIDNAIGSDHAQGIENVNLAGTDVLGAGVSNDPNRLVYDDDCYSQGGTFGDENIAGYVDANIAGTSTSVAKGNETKAAVEGFLFNW